MTATTQIEGGDRDAGGTTVHHVTVVATDSSRTARFLTDALRMPRVKSFAVPLAEIAPLLGWTSGPDPVASTLLGDGAGGLVELVEHPGARPEPPSTGVPAVGPYQLCFNVRDLDAVLKRGAADVDAVIGPRQLLMGGFVVRVAVVEIAGLRIQVAESRRVPLAATDESAGSR